MVQVAFPRFVDTGAGYMATSLTSYFEVQPPLHDTQNSQAFATATAPIRKEHNPCMLLAEETSERCNGIMSIPGSHRTCWLKSMQHVHAG